MKALHTIPGLIVLLFSMAACAGTYEAPSDTAATEQAAAPDLDTADYVKRDIRIPMRDGIELQTVLIMPQGVTKAPIILDRTVYGARRYSSFADSTKVADILLPFHSVLVEAGFIVALQDIRGKHDADGDYILARPLRGPLNDTGTDYATDAYDTIDWLVKNVPEATDRVGTMGLSYDGMAALMAMVNPHPALKASMPMGPMVDGWTGDDWFHSGAYRQTMMGYIHIQETTRKSTTKWPLQEHDVFDRYLSAGSASVVARENGLAASPFYRLLEAHPAYDDFWQGQALDKILGAQGTDIPTLLVHSQWDQEDIYGAIAVYKALQDTPKTTAPVRLVIGPWNHVTAAFGQGTGLGPLGFSEATADTFRRQIMVPFFKQHLLDEQPEEAGDFSARVLAYEAGSNVWRPYADWPVVCKSDCEIKPTSLYLRADGRLSLTAPSADDASSTSFVSDPNKPVPYRQRPIRPFNARGNTWSDWLMDDQRFASSRPDVLTFVSDPLESDMRLAGQAIAEFVASTTGTDADWVVKLIDVVPDPNPDAPELGSYQIPVTMDILRGRYREDPSAPKPIPANEQVRYSLPLPHSSYVFKKGHRMMVQVQSSWFPLYDRNPQTWVDNIFVAQPEDYEAQTHTVFHNVGAESRIVLPLIPSE